MDVVFLIGRIILALGILGITLGVLKNKAAAIREAKAGGVPAAEQSVPLVVGAGLVGALFIAFGVYADLGAILVAIPLLLMTPTRWAYWNKSGAARDVAKATFFRNVAVFGGIVIVFWVYNQLQGGAPLSLTAPLINGWF